MNPLLPLYGYCEGPRLPLNTQRAKWSKLSYLEHGTHDSTTKHAMLMLMLKAPASENHELIEGYAA
jgi:hypothetical protein